MRSEQLFRGTNYLSRRQVLALSKVSSATMVRALRIARGNRTSWGQKHAPGLSHKFIGRCLAVHQRDLAKWMAKRKALGCEVGVTKPLTGQKKRSG